MDVCVVCAVPVEAKAFLKVLAEESITSIGQDFSADGWQYHYAEIRNKAGERLTLQVSWLPRYGLSEVSIHLTTFLREFKPRFVAMTGICAGDRQKVRLGDLIVAERAYHPDTGKITVDREGNKEHQFDTQTAHPSNQIVSYARMFEGWKEAVAAVPRPVSTRNSLSGAPECYVAPIATTSAVRVDNPFAAIRIPVRSALGIDMEGFAFYRTLEDFNTIRSLLVKGVCDYADSEKDDDYQLYAAEVSARYMLAFIKEFVNERLMPSSPKEQVPSREAQNPSNGSSARKHESAAHKPVIDPFAQEQKVEGAVSILYIYAQKDNKVCEDLKKQLTLLRRMKEIQDFGIDEILAGDLKRERVQQKLQQADIILLMVSPNLIQSDELYEQLEPAWKRKEEGALVVPIIIKPVPGWDKTKFNDLEPLPKFKKHVGIATGSKGEHELYEIALEIRELVKARKEGNLT